MNYMHDTDPTLGVLWGTSGDKQKIEALQTQVEELRKLVDELRNGSIPTMQHDIRLLRTEKCSSTYVAQQFHVLNERMLELRKSIFSDFNPSKLTLERRLLGVIHESVQTVKTKMLTVINSKEAGIKNSISVMNGDFQQDLRIEKAKNSENFVELYRLIGALNHRIPSSASSNTKKTDTNLSRPASINIIIACPAK